MADASLDERRLIGRLAYLLRHGARERGLAMDAAGWVDVADVVASLNGGLDGDVLTVERIAGFIRDHAAERFELGGGRVRARYGHSIAGLVVAGTETPPENLFHGTAFAATTRIRQTGLRSMGRASVHLSSDFAYAERVARAAGPEWVVLRVRAADAARAGTSFRRASAHVWLADEVAADFVDFGDGDGADVADAIARRLSGDFG